MNRKKYLIILILGLPIIIYLLWPLSSSKWSIIFDNRAIEDKNHFLSQQSSAHSKHDYPNILLIMVDDLGMADLSLYGNGYPNTPNIDALGNEGITFTNAYVTSPVCSPSRAAILTGRYQQRFGFQYQMHERYLKNRMEYLAFKYFMNSRPWIPKWMDEVPDQQAMDKQGIPPSEILLPELLKTKGYQTAIIGKWHLGSDEMQTPCNLGFDYQYGFYASHSLYAYEKSDGIHDQKVENDFTDPHIWSGQRNGPHAIYRNCEEIKVTEFLTDRFANEAVTYLKEIRPDPFFLYLSFNAPHTPLQAPIQYMDQFKHIEDPIKRTYYAMIANLDDNIGKVISSLDVLGLKENTVVFFISDNGGAEYTYTTENGNYKGGKITNFEGGIKVPFIMNWPAKLMPAKYTSMVSSMDIFHSIINLTDIELPKNKHYDGVNLFPFISGDNNNTPHKHLFWQRGFSKAIRSNIWKLSINEDNKDTLLFNIVHDPFESTNVSDEQLGTVKQLITNHTHWAASLPLPLWPGMVYYEFGDGEKTYYFDQ